MSAWRTRPPPGLCELDSVPVGRVEEGRIELLSGKSSISGRICRNAFPAPCRHFAVINPMTVDTRMRYVTICYSCHRPAQYRRYGWYDGVAEH